MGPQAGQTICGHIRIEAEAEEELGSSAFGRVLVATSSEASGGLWLTVVGRELTPTPVDLSKFMAGANALLNLEHRSLVTTTVVDRESDFAVVGHAALAGARSLREVVAADGGRHVMTRVAIEIARGLTFLHGRGRLHGSLTPGSVLLVDGKVRLWQYGLAELCVAERFAGRSTKVGGDVVAPEVRKGAGATPASDVFSWGVIVASLASGCEGAEALLAVEDGAADFTEQRVLRILVERATSRNPSDRPSDGLELLEALSQLGGPDAKRAQKYFLDAHEDRDDSKREDPPTSGAGVPAPVAPADEATPKDGHQATAVLEEERDRQRERERQRAEIEAKNAMWAKAPPPIPIAPVKLKPPRPAAPKASVSTPSGERKPARPSAAVDTMPQMPGGQASASSSAELNRKPTPKAVGELDPADSAAFRPPAADQSVAHLQLELPEGATGVRTVGARNREEVEEPKPKPDLAVPRRTGQGRTIGEVTRRPGPHGPRGSLMAALIGLAATGLALWVTVAAAGAAGGMAEMMGLNATPSAPAPSIDDGEGPEALADKADVPAESGTPAATECPPEMAEHGPIPGQDSRYCVEVAEQPGLRQAPTTLVNFKEAHKSCEALGRRLCTEAEWAAACGGPAANRYPYGPGHQQDRCNEATAQGHVVDLTRSGARDGCKTELGVFDMVGNVSEWVAEGVALGGDATTTKPTCSTRSRLPRRSATAALGFRCCLTLAATASDPPADESPDGE